MTHYGDKNYTVTRISVHISIEFIESILSFLTSSISLRGKSDVLVNKTALRDA